MLVRFVHLVNALWLILVTLQGMVTLDRFVHS